MAVPDVWHEAEASSQVLELFFLFLSWGLSLGLLHSLGYCHCHYLSTWGSMPMPFDIRFLLVQWDRGTGHKFLGWLCHERVVMYPPYASLWEAEVALHLPPATPPG